MSHSLLGRQFANHKSGNAEFSLKTLTISFNFRNFEVPDTQSNFYLCYIISKFSIVGEKVY